MPHHRLGNPRIKTILGKFQPEKPKGKEKKAHKQRAAGGGSAKDIRGSDLSTSAHEVGTSFGDHSYLPTASTDGFAFRGRRDRR